MFIRVILLSVILLAVLSPSVFAIGIDCNGGRYEDNNNGTVSDCRTGLIWLKDANCLDGSGGVSKTAAGQITLVNAQKWVNGLKTGICELEDGSDVGDWRMPTKTEFMTMIQSAKKQHFTSPVLTDATGTAHLTNGCTTGCIFNNVHNSYYWTSTADPSNAANAWDFSMGNGDSDLNGSWQWVWPVRSGNDGLYKSLLIQ